jgi:hypothetical protein
MLSIYIVLLSWCWIVLIFLKRMGGETGGILDGGEVLPRPFTSLAQDTKLFEIKIIWLTAGCGIMAIQIVHLCFL